MIIANSRVYKLLVRLRIEDGSDRLDGSTIRPGLTYLTRPTRFGSFSSIKYQKY